MPMMGDIRPETIASRIDLSETSDFDLGGLRVSPAHRQVQMNGDCRDLEPRVAQVLVALASARPNVVSRDRLIDQCWEGRIVGDDAINRCIVALRHLAKSFSPEPFAIETVPRIGYCLVEVFQTPTPIPTRDARKRLVIGALIALGLIFGGLALVWSRVGVSQSAPASVAVLPFRNLGSGDTYFAQGIGEEILAQLAREPQFRVAGGRSSGQLESDSDIRDVARRLNVDYVLEGSVRRQADQVRVTADLVRASDGIRLWSDTYDGKLDDIFLIQQRIGGAIAEALRRKLIRTPTLSGPLVTNGEAYNLYLTARGLIRTRNRVVFVTSSTLLRDATKLDPNYAPAWASLAESTSLEDFPDGTEGLIAALPKAERYARQALRLAPDLADAHRVLGVLLPYGSPEALAHLRRAVELDPNNAEALIGLGSALAAAGEFDAEMAAYKRAREVDPVWFRTTGQLAIRLAETGHRVEAEEVGKRGFAHNEANLHIILGRIAWIFGDFSEAARHWSITARANSPRWSPRARMGVADVRMMVGIDPTPPSYKPSFVTEHQRSAVQVGAPPTSTAWQMHNRNAAAADVYRDDNHMAAKLMLMAGRARELAAMYDSPVGLLSLRPNGPVRADQLHEAPVVALALRQAGRGVEADRLLAKADSTISAVYRQRTIPFVLDADAAAILAVQGRREQALAMLERAMRRGWTDSGNTDLPNIADEPAFGSVRGQPRFDRLRATLAAHLARERAETVQLRI
jgi:TolB-like protein/DNA-binding winged helix-turn-helix (wHTH) protein/tetratricopeptide (TPR) repeat protein